MYWNKLVLARDLIRFDALHIEVWVLLCFYTKTSKTIIKFENLWSNSPQEAWYYSPSRLQPVHPFCPPGMTTWKSYFSWKSKTHISTLCGEEWCVSYCTSFLLPSHVFSGVKVCSLSPESSCQLCFHVPMLFVTSSSPHGARDAFIQSTLSNSWWLPIWQVPNCFHHSAHADTQTLRIRLVQKPNWPKIGLVCFGEKERKVLSWHTGHILVWFI